MAAQNKTLLSQIIASNDYPYSVSTTSWAGGNHTTSWSIGDAPSASCDTEKAWSKNGKWSGSNTSAFLTVTRRAAIELNCNMIIGGLVTLDLERVGNREYKAVWAEQSRGHSLKIVEGWLIRGYHVAGGTLENARKKAAKAREASLKSALETRAKKHIERNLNKIWVCFDDSIAAGNCSAGTNSVKKRIDSELGGDVCAVRADILLKFSDSVYARRAIQYAANHH
jgi:hypothetical protein